MEWKLIANEKPKHKELVLCNNGKMTLPAIYYKNKSFEGFYFFTTYYSEYPLTIYSKVRIKPKHEIFNVFTWMPIPNN